MKTTYWASNMWQYACRSGLVAATIYERPVCVIRPSMSKQAAYAAPQRHMPVPFDDDNWAKHTVSSSDDGDMSGFREEAKAREDQDALAAFDRDDSIDAMRAENLFTPVDSDEGNIVSELFSISNESEDDDSAFYEFDPNQDQYVDDVESDSEYEDEDKQFR
ncbi:Hypothetical protein PHPALM_13911 [Phytophthora palmivora]|uniref:Uncharacterized protein n=1 Tax=Phytophthora palmivora TaxID=4796 RepID=A0A2P4XW43_9STRA|nr:Hypothetical protein PHPALM_13911 [Phytophthora palmivora]